MLLWSGLASSYLKFEQTLLLTSITPSELDMALFKAALALLVILTLSISASAFRRYYYPNLDCSGPPRNRVNLKNHQDCQKGMFLNPEIMFTAPCVDGEPLPFKIYGPSNLKCDKESSAGVMRPQKGCIVYNDYSVITDCEEE